MIYHILNDEKFSDWVIDIFKEINPNNNRFILVSNKEESLFLDANQVEFLSADKFLNNLNPAPVDLVIFYFLHIHNIRFLLEKKKIFKTLWVGYGADYYYYLLNKSHYGSLHLLETDKAFKFINKKKGIRHFFLPFYQYLYFQIKVKKALKKIDFFAPIIPNEFNIIKNYFPDLFFSRVDFSFGDLDYLLGNEINSTQLLGKKVLIGNSATYANNHIDILILLKDLNISNRFFIPLSYGNQKYKEFIIDFCRENFDDQVEILDQFVPRPEYFYHLRDCGFVIMGHLRQQGMGNIYASLYMGAKLFLFKQNPVYEFLMDLGLIVFTIDELNKNPHQLNTLLSEEEITNNRVIMNSHYSRKSVLNRIKGILEL